MKKKQNNSPAVSQQDLQEMTHYIVSTMNEMFEQQNKKLGEHNKKFGEHDKRFDEHDRRFDEHDKRFDKLEKGQAKQLEISLQIVDELKSMREEQAAQANHNARTNDTLQDHDKRIIIIEQSFAAI